MAVKILVDSASDISREEAKKLNIDIIPLIVNFGNEEYLDGVNLLPKEFYDKLIKSEVLPKTSQINAYRYEEEFERLTKGNDELVVITLSSKLSGTYLGAKQAAEGRDNVYVVDSLTAAIGERLLCNYAIKLRDQGKTAREIAEKLEEKKSKIKLYAMLGTLEYLKKGGRISSTVAFAGKLLNLKPVVGVVDGEVKLVSKAMGVKNGQKQVIKLAQESRGIDLEMPFGLVWSGLDENIVKGFSQEASGLWQDKADEAQACLIGCTIGTHIGPGAVGLAFFEK